ncbi:MAG: sulfite exporter TauE/SafE family protein [Phreatobacter sp.]|uniref:sulfite exporter TauE/SafE family protein n=1 Tax=Phreatobacter sp. TaxID=1966341 RepID=UPI001A53E90E|nr:sulfite exporter TauE/SafE family protein [Phreatobacter sp.]MBL8569137.1 sulfite exporter TauE/SafE family protein [Phreatobacter sp.]
MEPLAVILLFAAGLAGGIVNAIAGGASLITFPAMLAAGLPPVVANASNALAVTPGHLAAAVADREALPRDTGTLTEWVLAGLIGGAVGAVILLVTPERLFMVLVPPLIGGATAIFAFGPAIRQRLAAGRGAAPAGPRRALIFAICTYGGYFGAGLGVMLMAAIALVRHGDQPRTANALKNLCGSAVSVAGVGIFIWQGLIAWPPTVVMLAGSVIGGIAGGRLLPFLPAPVVRAAVILAGVVLTLAAIRSYWF